LDTGQSVIGERLGAAIRRKKYYTQSKGCLQEKNADYKDISVF